MEKVTLTVKEAAKYMGISIDLVYRESKYGSLPSIRVGRRVLFRKESLDKWMTEQEVQCS